MGVCSRREADRLIEAGKVLVDNRPASMGQKVTPGQKVVCNGKMVRVDRSQRPRPVLLAVNKPKGVVCTTTDKDRAENIVDFLGYPERIYPVGRLDKDSEGLLLLTNNGEIVNKMMRSGNRHEKEYIVTVNKTISDSFIRGLAGGVPLVELGVTTRKCHVKKLSSKQFKIILTQGYNRQIRRMCEYFGYRVVKLERVRIMNIELGDLPRGKYRAVTPLEYKGLKRLIADSSNQPVMPDTNKNHSDKKYTDKKHTDKKYPDRRAK